MGNFKCSVCGEITWCHTGPDSLEKQVDELRKARVVLPEIPEQPELPPELPPEPVKLQPRKVVRDKPFKKKRRNSGDIKEE
jgi:hypothetical protein